MVASPNDDMILTDETKLHDYVRNPDGKTYDAGRLVTWLIFSTTGKQISKEEAAAIVEEAVQRRRERK